MKFLLVWLFSFITLFGQEIIWEKMNPPPFEPHSGISLFSDSNNNIFFEAGDVFLSLDSAVTWRKIYEYESSSAVKTCGMWDDKITMLKSDNKIYQYNLEAKIWSLLELNIIPGKAPHFHDTPEFRVLSSNTILYFQDKITSKLDSLGYSESIRDGFVWGNSYFRIADRSIETYNFITGDSSIIYTGSEYINKFFNYNNIFYLQIINDYFDRPILISYDSGVSWTTIPETDASLELVDFSGIVYKMKDDSKTFYISEDTCKTWVSLNIGFIEPGISTAFYNKVKYAYVHGMKRYTGEQVSYYAGRNFVPLHVGNKYLYKTRFSGWQSWVNRYSIKEILKDTLIDNIKYYSFGEENYYNYNHSNNEYTAFSNNMFFNQMSFSYPDGKPDTIEYVSGYKEVIAIATTYTDFYGIPRFSKGFDKIDGFNRNSKFYAENLGLVSSFSAGDMFIDETKLIEAYIYSDSLQDFIYYTKNKKAELYEHAVNSNGQGKIEIITNLTHPYSEWGEYNPPYYSFIDTAYVDYAFYSNNDTTDFCTIFQDSLMSGETVNFHINVNDIPVTVADSLIFCIRTVDKNLIPDRQRFPEYGYFIVDINQLTGIEKNDYEVLSNNTKKYYLGVNYPNPFNPETKISYSLKEAGNVELIVYDVLGNEVVKLVNEHKPAGSYEVSFNGANLPSGIYIYRIKSGEFSESKKMILLK